MLGGKSFAGLFLTIYAPRRIRTVISKPPVFNCV
jgi:hypothetical protein